MSIEIQHGEQDISSHQKQIAWLQVVTILWMCAEAAVAILAAVHARSVALLGFGLDSGIEFLSAFVVLLQFKKVSFVSEKRTAQITGLLLFALAIFVLGGSILAFTKPEFRPEPSYLGIGLLIAAALVMPWLAAQKRKLSAKTNSASLRADAVQSSMCACLAWITLGGLALNAIFEVSWVDPVAALLLLPIVLREGSKAIKGKPVCDCAL